MRRVLLLMLVAVSCITIAVAMGSPPTATKSISDQILAATINSSNDAAASEVLALQPETGLVKANAGATALCPMTAVSSSPPNCDVDLATAKNAKVQVAAANTATSEWFNTGPPAAAMVQFVNNTSPPQVFVQALANDPLLNSGDAFLEMRSALHQDGQSQGGVAVRANHLVT